MVEFLRGAPAFFHPGWGPREFTGWRDEQLSWKTGVYLGDWSFLWDIEFQGPDALKVIEATGVNSVENFAIGQAKHLVQCDDNGKVIAEGILMRISENTFRTQSTTAFYTAFSIDRGDWDASFRVIDTFQLQVSGPLALPLVQELTGEDLTDIPFMHFREVTVAGVSIYALRQGMAGEIGFELHGDAAQTETVTQAILAAGEKHGIRRIGGRTAMTNHLEAGFPTGGWHYLSNLFVPGLMEFMGANFDLKGMGLKFGGSWIPDDITDFLVSPYDLGWGRSVKFDHDFTGRAALEAEAAHRNKTRVTLEFDNDDVFDIYRSQFTDEQPYEYMEIPHQPHWTFWADRVETADGTLVGYSSVPGFSAYFRRVISLSFIEVEHATPGTELFVVWGAEGSRQKRIRATVAPSPYKTDNRRADLHAVAATV
jgi:vanillate/3-O-methylgallate O-demethylase